MEGEDAPKYFMPDGHVYQRMVDDTGEKNTLHAISSLSASSLSVTVRGPQYVLIRDEGHRPAAIDVLLVLCHLMRGRFPPRWGACA